jgi:hypothetical protein
MNDVEGSDEVVQSLIDVIGFAPDISLIRGSEPHMNKEDALESIREPTPGEEKTIEYLVANAGQKTLDLSSGTKSTPITQQN